MAQTPRLFQPVVREELAQPEQHLGLLHNPSTRQQYLSDEDNNLGDEAFVRVAEDPEFYLLLDTTRR